MYNKFIVANVVLGPAQTIVAPMRVYLLKPTLEQQRIVQDRRWRDLQERKRRSTHGRGGSRKYANMTACNAWVRREIYIRFWKESLVHDGAQTRAGPVVEDDEVNFEWAEYIEVPASSLNSCFCEYQQL